MSRTTAIAAGAVFTSIAAVAGGLYLWKTRPVEAGGGWGEPAEAVQVASVRTVQWQPMADLVGTVLSLRSVSVSTKVAGVIREVRFESGAIVEPGQVLITLDDAVLQADLAAALAGVRVAAANVVAGNAMQRLAQTEQKRLEEIFAARAGATQTDLDRAAAELARTTAETARLEAEVEQAKARAVQVEARIAEMTIRAPFRARAGLRLVHEGQYLGDGGAVVNLEEVSGHVFLDFAIPQDYLVRVKKGMKVMATAAVLGPDPVEIVVDSIDAAVNFDTRNVRVRAIVENKDDVLRQGMFIQLRVPTEEPRPYLVIPATAVRRTSYAEQVFVVVPGEAEGELRASQRFVRLGPAAGEDVIVLEGLKEGELVASTGSFKLRDKAKVMKVEPKP